MKTIEISDELYERLKFLSNEIKSQDNRGTASPYFYQVMEKKEDRCWEDNCEKIVWYGNEMTCEDDCEKMIEFLKEYGECCLNGYEDAIKEWSLEDIDEYDLETMFEYLGFYKVPIKTVYQFSNAFLTEKSILKHIECNGHHYEKPKTFLQYAYRNPDMETIFEFLNKL